MAQNLVINDVTYNGVESLSMINEDGEKVEYHADAVKYVEQSLTDEQKAQARANIGIDGVCVAKNQGTANVGKILVVGTDGNLTLTDMPEGGASGDVIGTLDDSNNILLSGNLADGTYTLKYENADGTYTEIGNLVVGDIVVARLPAEYQEVEWVQIVPTENAGINQSLHTDIPWNTANKIVTKVQNVTSSNTRDVIISSWSSASVKASPYIATRTDKTPNTMYGYVSGLTNYAISPSDIVGTDTNAREYTMTFTATAATDICFGGWYDNANSHPHKWYYMEVYNGDTLLGNFIPCYRIADSIIGFYDLVGGKFYANAGNDSGGFDNFNYKGNDV